VSGCLINTVGVSTYRFISYYKDQHPAPLLGPFSQSLSTPTVDEYSEYWDEADEAFFSSADLTTPQSTPQPIPPSTVVLSRWIKQPPSATCKVAYVLFTTGGEPEDLGVYYNWYVSLFNYSLTNKSFDRTACNQSITRGGGKEVCSFRGYRDYQLAHAAWSAFQIAGIIPLGSGTSPKGSYTTKNFPQRSRSHTPHTPQQSSRGITSQQGSPALPPPALFSLGTPQRSTSGPISQHAASPLTLYGPGSPQISSRSPMYQQDFEHSHDFWVVLTGYHPGVYQT
jgi:hypothetical protein